MTVVFLNPVATLGGAERCLVDVLAVLRAARPGVGLHLIAGADGPLLDEARRAGATAAVVPLPAAAGGLGESQLVLNGGGRLARTAGLLAQAARAAVGVPGYLRRLRRAVGRARPALVHSNGMKTHLLAGYAAPPGVPVVWHLHDFVSTRPVLGRWLRRLARPPAVAVANSEAVAADARAALPGVRVEAVYNGVDTDRFSPGPGDGAGLDRLAGLSPAPPGTVRAGLVATYARWKGQEVFVDAAAAAADRLRGVRFYLVGGPQYATAGSQWTEAELRQRVAAGGLAGRCGLVPFQPDPRPVYRGLDVVVHASTRPEPFGLTIAEAMACGRAVVVTLAGGAAELATDGVDAVGVPPGDVAALAEALVRLGGDPALRAALGAAARATAVARFDRRRMGGHLLRVYDSLVPSW